MKRLALVLPLFVLGALACSKDDPPGGGATTPIGTDAGTDDADTTADTGAAPGGQCTAAREATLKPIDKVSTGAVSIVKDEAGVKTLYVDGSAGGLPNSSKNPAVYINLETGTKVDVTDVTSLGSTEWDLSIKRTVIYTNGGDGGPGTGGAARVAKDFAAVTSADATKIQTEKFFDADCNALLDQASFLETTFSPDWYTYDQTTNGVTPVTGVTYVVVGGGGKKYKLAIDSYNGKPDGTTTAPAGGYFLFRISAL